MRAFAAEPRRVDRDIAERVLGHTVGSTVENTYDRHDYVAEVGAALLKLEAEIRRIVGARSIEPAAADTASATAQEAAAKKPSTPPAHWVKVKPKTGESVAVIGAPRAAPSSPDEADDDALWLANL